MFENSDCTDCDLAHRCVHRCLPGLGDETCKLAIYLDSPSMVEDRTGRSWTGDNANFVNYCLDRMSVPREMVYRDYILKCYAAKLPGPKVERMTMVARCSQYRFANLEEMPGLRAMVVLGGLGCEAMLGHKTIGDKQGAEWKPLSPLMQQLVPHVWVGFSQIGRASWRDRV